MDHDKTARLHEDQAAPPQPSQSHGAVEQEDAAHLRALEETMRALQTAIRTGANWFWWVAGLSLVNSAIALAGGQLHFVVGLGVTLIADLLAQGAAQQNANVATLVKLIVFAFDVLVAALVFGTGWLARKRYIAAFALGMFCYTLDGLIFVLFQDWLSVAFHGLALFGMWKGLQACLQWRKLERAVLQTA